MASSFRVVSPSRTVSAYWWGRTGWSRWWEGVALHRVTPAPPPLSRWLKSPLKRRLRHQTVGRYSGVAALGPLLQLARRVTAASRLFLVSLLFTSPVPVSKLDLLADCRLPSFLLRKVRRGVASVRGQSRTLESTCLTSTLPLAISSPPWSASRR